MSHHKSINVAVLAAMCTPIASQDDLQKYLNVPNRDLMIQALKDEQEKIHKEAAKEAAVSIINLCKEVDEHKLESVNRIRRLRAEIEMEKTRLDDIDRLLDYGNETGNYLPLVRAVKGSYALRDANIKECLTTVPDDWKPAAKKAAPKK